MARVYTVTFENVAVTAAQDAFYVKPAADKVCEILGVFLSPVVSSTSDWGDANTEIDRIRIRRVPATVTVGSGGSSATPRPLDVNDTAAGFTARTNDTTQATSSGTIVDLHTDGWNMAAGYQLWLPEGCQPRVANAEAIVVSLPSTPANSKSLSGTLYVRELP